jgi:arylsulfatase A-like enzyme
VQYFKYLHKARILENTIVFLFADHGSRYGPMRATLQGKLEERLPLQIISLPKSFVERFPR